MRTLSMLLAVAIISSNALANLQNPEASTPITDGDNCVINGFDLVAGGYAGAQTEYPSIAGTMEQYRAKALSLCAQRGILLENANSISNAGIGGGWSTLSEDEISSCKLVTEGPAGRVTLNGLQTAGQIVCNDHY
jgi:hypothetical protein